MDGGGRYDILSSIAGGIAYLLITNGGVSSVFGQHSDFIEARMKRGSVVLVLGAGANYGAQNRHGQPIADGKGLAKIISDEIGEAYQGEALSEVTSAAEMILGRDGVRDILIREFRFCKPSTSVKSIMKYTWNRIYTWNYDDSLQDCAGLSVQRPYIYNGMKDAVEDIPETANLQIVFLHGMITKIDEGIILSTQEYSKAIYEGGHKWYKRLSQDYRSKTVIFIGSSLAEPILNAELERLSQTRAGDSGKAFVITPTPPSPLSAKALESRGIIHVPGTAAEFVDWLEGIFGVENSPVNVLETDEFFNPRNLSNFSLDDIAAAHTLKPIRAEILRNAFENEAETLQGTQARQFLTGFPASWAVASSKIPVRLSQLDELKRSIEVAARKDFPLFVTVGQAGSGKSTATMQALLDLSTGNEFDVFELDSSAMSVNDSLGILRRLSDKPKLVYLQNLFIFGASLGDSFQIAKSANVTFVTTARTSEWKEHFERHFFSSGATFQFQRFSYADYDPLIERLKRYVPSPKFVKLKYDQQVERLNKSKSQLLIALREATESRNFEEIILDEYRSLSSADVRDLFIIIGLSTLARVGVSRSSAAEAYESKVRSISFLEALDRLGGIVLDQGSGRLQARHEFYVRNVLDSAVDIEFLLENLKGLLSTFTKYQIPITRHVNRQDAALFRFLLNHSFIRERTEKAGDKYSGLEIYREFEIQFQLDGHFWLQYGLYYKRLNDVSSAIRMLEKSIEAFPGNPFAIHALASERLRQASIRNIYDGETRKLVSLAVEALERLQAIPLLRIDQYPLVTLSRYHVGVLVKYDQGSEAVKVAKDYYGRLLELEKATLSDEIVEEKARLLKFVSAGVWERPALS